MLPYYYQTRLTTLTVFQVLALHFSLQTSTPLFHPSLVSCHYLKCKLVIHVVVRIWQQPPFVDLKRPLYGNTRTNILVPQTEIKNFFSVVIVPDGIEQFMVMCRNLPASVPDFCTQTELALENFSER